MALCDYRVCDVCGGKAFYDAELNYNFERNEGPVPAEERVRISGREADDWGYSLDRVGEWAVICRECAKEYRTQIVRRQADAGGQENG
jgi:hypothetical protein